MILAPATECIYCGDVNPGRTTEHIVPKALLGNIELPEASCEKCQSYINHEIEEPVFSRAIKPFRTLSGLTGRSRRGKDRQRNALTHWPIEIVYYYGKYRLPLDRETAVIPLEEVPVPHLWFDFGDPPFLQLNTGKKTVTRYETITHNREESKKLHDRLMERVQATYRKPGFSTGYTFCGPKFRMADFKKALIKMACGFFYDACRDHYLSSSVRIDLFSDISKNLFDGSNVYSADSAKLRMPISRAVVFDVCEFGVHFAYCYLNPFMDTIGYNYLVRIRLDERPERIWKIYG